MKGKISLSDVGENPLPDRFDVRVDEARFLAPVADKIFKLKGVYKVKYGGDIAKRLINLSNTVSWVGGGMADAGAGHHHGGGQHHSSDRFRAPPGNRNHADGGRGSLVYSGPLRMEGIVQSLAGSALAIFVLSPGYESLAEWLTDTLPFLPSLPGEQLGEWLYPLLILLGGLVGALGSLLSVNRYLKI